MSTVIGASLSLVVGMILAVVAVVVGLRRYIRQVKRMRTIRQNNRAARGGRAPSPMWEIEVDGQWVPVD